jgi:perosamine synthetase
MDIYFEKTVEFIRDLYSTKDPVPLHQPSFIGKEKQYLEECIDTGYVSSAGEFVNLFEKKIADFCGTKYAVATVNGTSALHIALLLAGVKPAEEVITQPFTFIATVNPITYCAAHPVFVDIDTDTLGLSPEKVYSFLEVQCIRKKDGHYYNKQSGRRIAACLPMHTFGHPTKIDGLVDICKAFKIPIVEDAAESLGSYYKEIHTGAFGLSGVLSFNGNKIITAGGGGAIITNDEALSKKAKHLTTQAKINHPWSFEHDEIGFNYRMPNINAAICLAQLENIKIFLETKRRLANLYDTFFKSTPFTFIHEPKGATSNYWLNAILTDDLVQRDDFLEYTNGHGIKTRPAWHLINQLEMYKHCQTMNLENSINISERLVNLPSSYSKHIK